jgi:hypothetical protein
MECKTATISNYLEYFCIKRNEKGTGVNAIFQMLRRGLLFL